VSAASRSEPEVKRVPAAPRLRGSGGRAWTPRELLILERVCAVPEGFVRTYGDISPDAPRMTGRVLSECDDPQVPWFRIVRADGSLAKGRRQRRLLRAEGVPFSGERVDMRIARVPW